MRRFIPEVTASEAAALTRELIAEDNRVVLATAPEKPGVTAVTEAASSRGAARRRSRHGRRRGTTRLPGVT